MNSRKLSVVIFWMLIVGSVLAAVKMLLFDYTLDEEYQIVMAYRNIRGDHLFTQMWEPHQSSAFLCVWLMKLYMVITGGTTGVVLWLRGCTLFIQIGISLYMYKVMHRIAPKEYAFLLALTYFNIVPKLIQIPEFGNMQVWFYTLLVLFLMRYYLDYKLGIRKQWGYLVLGGISMSLTILAYPSCLLLFLFICLVILLRSKEGRLKDLLIFAGTCAMCGAAYLFLLLRNISFRELIRNITYSISSDLTHDFMSKAKIDSMIFNIKREAMILFLVLGLAFLCYGILYLWKRKEGKRKPDALLFLVIAFVVSCAVQIYYWVILKSGYEFPQIQLVMLLVIGCVVYRKVPEEKRKVLSTGIIASLLCYVAVIWFSDLQMVYALPHGILAPLFCMLLFVYVLEERRGDVCKVWCYVLLVTWCLTSIWGKGYTLRDGRGYNTVWETRGIIKHGPAAGIMADYMSVYIYNCNYEDWQQYVKPGDKVLIVSNLVMSSNTTPYMFQDVEISHYSIVNPTAYDERLLEYWSLYPEKQPDVIIVDCWYGELKENPESWIMQYIENQFSYRKYYDGRYVRFYRN